MGRRSWLWYGFIAFAMLLSASVSDDLYSRSPGIKSFADFMSAHVMAIDQLAAVSNFPGTTRVVLSILGLFIPPLFLIHLWVPGMVTWQPQPQHSRILLTGLIVFVLAMFVGLPLAMTVNADDLVSGPGNQRAALKLLSHSRLGLGFGAGTYCVTSTYLLALLPRAVRALFDRA